MTVKDDAGTIKELQAKVTAQQKTINVLMDAVEQQFIKGATPFELLAQNLNLEQIVQRKTAVLQQQGDALQKALNDLQRTQAELLQAKSKAFQDSLLETIPIPVFYKDTAGRYLGFNKAFEDLFGQTKKQMLGKSVFDVATAELAQIYHAKDIELFEEPRVQVYESRVEDANGVVHEVIFHKASCIDSNGAISGLIGVILDITERKRAEAEREKLQSQLNHAQKIESVGRLAGGVAHDFNNMLSVILGYAELALSKVAPSEPIHKALREIFNAAMRSAEITRHLLAFARKQTIAPKVLDLNETVEGMLKMLRRLIGEDINLAWLPGPGLWPVKLDPSQMDQVLANLCVNARDAVTGVGKITIETGTATVDDAYCAEHADFIPGDFVVLSVSDDGCGMDKETLSHIFEPFFTTKGEGQGTGLGLSTVYGIVKQNEGFVNVYSELGTGTTFSVYLPRHVGAITGDEPTNNPALIPPGHGETILIVEDEAAMLELYGAMLETLGYAVLTANTPGEALQLAKAHAGKVNLLITDVVMPEMNGRDLANALHTLLPDLKILFMSGYTANVIAHRGILDEGVRFIQKPFSIKDLAAKVRDTLGRM